MTQATVHALSAVHAVSIDRATEMYTCGLQYDLRYATNIRRVLIPICIVCTLFMTASQCEFPFTNCYFLPFCLISEKQLLAHYMSKNMSKEALQKLEKYAEKLRRALDSEEFLKRL